MKTREFSSSLMSQVYGQDLISAVLSGVSPGTRARYLAEWRHWEQFMRGKQFLPWIWRTCPDWGDNFIYYIMFGAKILGNSPNTISAKISGVRFWRLLVGVPDFTLGGGRYTQVLKSVRRNSRAGRKIPATLDMLSEVALHRNPEDIRGVGIASGAVVGFFFRLRLGELGSLRWMAASLSVDNEGDACLRLTLPRSKTDQ